MHKHNPLRAYPGQILGYRKDGRAIYAIGGASPDGDGGEGGDAGTDARAEGADDDKAGGETGVDDAGKGPEGEDASGAESVDKLPDWAQKIVRDARKDAGKARTDAKKAAEDAVAQLTQSLGKALGLVKDDQEQAPDPAKLAEQLAAQTTAAKSTAVELAVFRTASKHGGDPAALTDSRTFLAKVADLDTSAKDFEAKVVAAAKAAVTENTKLKAGQAPGASGVDHGGTGGERTPGKPKPLNAAVSAHYGT